MAIVSNGTDANSGLQHSTSADPTISSSTTTTATNQQSNDIINTLYVLVSFLAIASNAFVIAIIAFHQPLRKRLPNYFLVNQCVLDLVMGLALLITMTFQLNNIVGPLPVLSCYVVQTRLIFTSALLASIWNLVAMAFERYMEIVHPIRHKLSLTRRKVVVGLVSVWLIGFSFKTWLTTWSTTFTNGVCTVGRYSTIALTRFGGIINIVVEFLFPFLAIVFCYVEMARALRKKKKIHGNNSGSQLSKASVSIMKLLVLISIGFLICIGPRDLYGLQYFIFLQPIDFNSVMYLFFLILNASSCWINPLIFMIKYEEFHRGVRALAARCRRRNTDSVGPLPHRANATAGVSGTTITSATRATADGNIETSFGNNSLSIEKM